MSARRVICTFLFFLVPAVIYAQESRTIWDRLNADDPATANRMSAREKAALQALTQEQLDAYLAGQPASEIYLESGETLADLLKATSNYEINWFAFTAGGSATANASYRVESTIGQPFVSTASNNDYTLDTGFWVITKERVHDDDFENGDFSGWSSCVGCVINSNNGN